jgi:hypothetical protein
MGSIGQEEFFLHPVTMFLLDKRRMIDYPEGKSSKRKEGKNEKILGELIPCSDSGGHPFCPFGLWPNSTDTATGYSNYLYLDCLFSVL